MLICPRAFGSRAVWDAAPCRPIAEGLIFGSRRLELPFLFWPWFLNLKAQTIFTASLIAKGIGLE